MRRLGSVLGTIVCAIGLSSCGADDEPEPPVVFVSGSRLRAVVQEVDGVRQFNGWFDTKLGTRCYLEGNACVPVDSGYAYMTLYADAACTDRVVPAKNSPAFLVVDSPELCAIELRVPEAPVFPSVVYEKRGSGCHPRPTDEEATYFHIGPLAPADAVVRMTEQNDSASARIARRWMVGDDGSRTMIGAWDTQRNEPVYVGALGPRSPKQWLPARNMSVSTACPDVASSYACGEGATSVYVPATEACGDAKYFSVGKSVETAACAPGRPTFAIGAPIPPESFAGARTMHLGPGRVKISCSAAGDTPIGADGLVDSSTGQPCFVQEVAGVKRCMPPGGSSYFADARCSDPAYVLVRHAEQCETSSFPSHVTIGETPFALEAIAAAPSAFQMKNDVCVAFEPPPSTTIEVRRLRPLDPASFPAITERTE